MFSIVSAMVLSRYFNKVDYGTYKQILYVYNSLLVIFTLGLPRTYSFFLPRVPIEEAKSVIKKINNILIASGLCMGGIIYFGAELIANLLNNNELINPLRCFSLVPIFLLPTIGLDGILATYKKTQLLAFYNIATKILLLVFVVTPVVFMGGGVVSAILGFSVASFISFLLAAFLKYWPIKKITPVTTSLSYKEIFNYAIPLFIAGFWGVLISSSDQFFISRYFGAEVFAEFANGALELPFVGMVIAATMIVLAPIYSKKAFEGSAKAKEEIIQLWHSVLSKTIKLTYPLIAFFYCFADMVMVALYGQAYVNSGEYFEIKLLVNFFTIVSFGPLILSIGGNKYFYRVHMYGAIVLIALQALSVLFISSPLAIVWVSVICEIGRILALLLFVAKYFDVKLYQLFPWAVIAKLTPCFIILYALKYGILFFLETSNVFIIISTAALLYLMLFVIWAHIAKLDYLSIIKPLLKRAPSK
jgi:O-antigen/teichoic acid export membrane protein